MIIKSTVARAAVAITATLLLVIAFIALRIYTYGDTTIDMQADAAIVLGAAVWSEQVSPVLRERINHALDLYRHGKVRKIVFTGGQGNKNEATEAAAARAYAIEDGIPAGPIMIEESWHTTFRNRVNPKQRGQADGLYKHI